MKFERVLSEGLNCDDWLSESTADTENGIVRDVVLCGNKSGNGYSIPPEAFGSADRVRRLYENKLVYLDHPDRKNPHQERQLRHLAGIIRNVRFEGGRPLGDIATKGCPLAKVLLDLVEAKLPGVGLSHVASYRFSDKSMETVESVNAVLCVDVVSNPATTKSFYEQQQKDDGDMQVQDLLTKQVDGLESKVATLQESLTEKDREIDRLTEAVTAAESRTAELKGELETVRAELIEHQDREATRALLESVNRELVDAGLDPSDKDMVSPYFLESLQKEANADIRKNLIEDRAKLVKGKKVAKSTQRHSDTPSPEGFNLESFLDKSLTY